MAWQIVHHVFETSQHSGGALLVLLAIADNANGDGIAWPGVRYIARKCRLTERYVRRIISTLQSSGEIEIRYRTNQSNVFRFPGWSGGHYTAPKIESETADGGGLQDRGGMSPRTGGGCPTGQGGDVLQDRGVGAYRTGRTSIEPPEKPDESESCHTPGNVNEIWEEALATLSLTIESKMYDDWFQSSRVIEDRSDGKLVVEIRKRSNLAMMNTRIVPMVERVLADAGHPMLVEFVVRGATQ